MPDPKLKRLQSLNEITIVGEL